IPGREASGTHLATPELRIGGRAVPDSPQVRELLDELLASDTTPEVVCQTCPELLAEVRARWLQVCRLRAELDGLFPPFRDTGEDPCPPPTSGLPFRVSRATRSRAWSAGAAWGSSSAPGTSPSTASSR